MSMALLRTLVLLGALIKKFLNDEKEQLPPFRAEIFDMYVDSPQTCPTPHF